jgi:peptide deformylase
MSLKESEIQAAKLRTVHSSDAHLLYETAKRLSVSPVSANNIKKRLQSVFNTCPTAVAIASTQVQFPADLEAPTASFYYKNKIYLNPSYIAASDSDVITSEEGCLSDPGRCYLVARYTHIIVTYSILYNTLKGQRICTYIRDKSDFEAIVFQHEIDHLQGRVIWDIGTRCG